MAPFISQLHHLRSILLAFLLIPLVSQAAPPLKYITGGCHQVGDAASVCFTTTHQQGITHFTYHHSRDGKHFETLYSKVNLEDHTHPGSYCVSFRAEVHYPNIRGGWNHFKVTAHESNGFYYELFQDSVYLTVPSTPVFPGDANSDGQVNGWDFVTLCSALGETGPTRPNATTNQTLQPAPDWDRNFFDGADYKHADCNGDGVINLEDAAAIRANYGDLVVNGLRAGCGSLALRLEYPDSAEGGDTVNVEVWLGEDGNPVPDAYGFVLGFACHNENVAPTFVELALDTSWLGTPGQDLAVWSRDELINEGWCDIAVSRTDGQQRSGAGRVACLSIVMVDDIAKDELERLLAPQIEAGLVLTSTLRDVSWADPSVVVEGSLPEVAGVGPVLLSHDEYRIYPNPFDDRLILEGDFDTFNENTKVVGIYDMQGQLIFESMFSGEFARMRTGWILPGSYLIKVESANNSVVRRIVKH